MIYTEPIRKAANLSYQAHHGQVDKGGYPYILHPLHLAEQMDSEDAVIVALLHDVVEDTSITLDDLRAEGFSCQVIEALVLLTHDKAVPYMDYISKISANPLARQVKLADLRHNSDPTRLDRVDRDRLDKYRQAIKILESSEQ